MTRLTSRGAPWALVAVALSLAACQNLPPKPRPISPSHLNGESKPLASGIPQPVRETPILSAPKPRPPSETYTVVVNDVPVKELLFAVARDAKVNIDIAPGIRGDVTLNAVKQTLDQILDRVARQVDLRYDYKDGTLVIRPDEPYEHTYKIDYVNLSRDTSEVMSVSTELSSTAGTTSGGSGTSASAGGQNNSTTSIKTVSDNRLWSTLTSTVRQIIAADEAAAGVPPDKRMPLKDTVIPNPEGGLLTVVATQRQQKQIQAYLDEVMASVTREVLIEATIVEVDLKDEYRAGIDWAKVASGAGFSIGQALVGSGLATSFTNNLASGFTGAAVNGGTTGFVMNYQNGAAPSLQATLSLLKQFGNTRVLSSPKVMALNNHTAVLKSVTNEVYFTATTTVVPGNVNTNATTAIDTTPHVIPVGVILTVTPEVSASDDITLSVRPTITRISGSVTDPNPDLNGLSKIPVIDTREMESVLKLHSGQIAVLGGLFQDSAAKDTNGVPLLSDIPGVGAAFKYHGDQYNKSELVVFLRPTVIRSPSVEGDFANYRYLLPKASDGAGKAAAKAPGDQ